MRPSREIGDGGTATATDGTMPADDWYKEAVVYQLHVRSFRDSDGDGVGDFRGLIEKLDHIVDLGVTAIWVQPFYPSPGRDDGYDIADYRGVNPGYGTLRDVRRFIAEAHRRGLKVITELVCNHTSDQHAWFQASRRAQPGTRARNRYVWSDTPDRYRGTRIIFGDFETSNWTWDPVAGAYFWHRFYGHQPDLNFDDPRVHRDLLGVVDFWLGAGVDGLRLDAIPYLYEREGTNNENLPETHAFLKMLRRYVDERFPGRGRLAEGNQWAEKAVAYFGEGRGDECHMAFHFPVMPRLYMALRREDRFPIVDILAQTPPIPETAQWGMFLRNHDELTLEMVTDEERDFMIRAYADDPQARINLGIRRRLAPLLRNDRRRIELLNGLLFSMPGTPFIYYGDEIGMGDNLFLGDRNGVRTPMQWSADLNAGFSSAEPSRLSLPVITDEAYHYSFTNVAAQQANPHSLLWWMRRLISLRRRHPAFGRGTMEILSPDDRRILAFIRRTDDERLLVVANLSRFARSVELDLAEHAGWQPIELFGRSPFPVIGADGRTTLTMAPHAFLWFELVPPRSDDVPVRPAAGPPPRLAIGRWSSVLDGSEPTLARALGAAVARWLPNQPWNRSPLRPSAPVEIVDVLPFGPRERAAVILVRPSFVDGEQAMVQLLLAFTDDDPADGLEPRSILGQTAERGSIVDASAEPWLGEALLTSLARRRRLSGRHGAISADAPAELAATVERAGDGPSMTALPAGRNATFRLGGSYLKLYRRIEAGRHPELEIGRSLRGQGQVGLGSLVVALEYRGTGAPVIVGGAGQFVRNEGTAWGLMLGAATEFIDRVATGDDTVMQRLDLSAVLADPGTEPPAPVRSAAGAWGETARRIGLRAGELHLALARDHDRPGFRPDPFGELYQRALYQAIRGRFHDAASTLHEPGAHDPAGLAMAEELRATGRVADPWLRSLLDHPLETTRIRIHGDLQLRHILDTGDDVVIVDFEGPPARPLTERWIVRSPLRDIAMLIASFVRVMGAAADAAIGRSVLRPADPVTEARLLGWVAAMSAWVLHGYLSVVEGAHPPLVPAAPQDFTLLLRALTIDALCVAIIDTTGSDHDDACLLMPALRALATWTT